MSTGLIIAIVVVALVLLAVLFFIPRMRRKAEMRKRERELGQRREAVATEHREHADTRAREADEAERRARMAQKEAERERAEAELHQERASMHERGEADHELIDDHERDRFAGTSAMSPGTDRDDDADRPARFTRRNETDATDGSLAADNDYERGRRDEAIEERRS
jgi:type II secretory pathway pseudopilin PulG